MIDYFSPVGDATILVVGDVILDQYVYGDTSRISPEAPVPVVKVHTTEERPGGAANVAMNIRALGTDVQLLGITGDDEYSDKLSSMLEQAGVGLNFIRQGNFPTVTKLRVLSQNQQLLRLDYEAPPGNIKSALPRELYLEKLEHADLVVLSDYAKGSLQLTTDFIGLARDKGIRVLVDPKGNDFSRYHGASFLTPNLKEFETVVGPCSEESVMVTKAKELCESLALEGLLITRGKRGISLIDAVNNKASHLSTQAHEVFDVTGAGDTVIAVLAVSLASSIDLEQAVNYANLAAGLVVEKLGAATVDVDELNVAIGNQGSHIGGDGVVDPKQLENVLASARARKEKIVMSNGCFDILHAGHVDYLRKAKQLGDRLLIAVNDDESVKRLKGKNRPVNTVENRMSVLAGLDSTDWICQFSEDTPEKLIHLVKPDVLVKGGDYAINEIAGAEFVTEYGGDVVTIPFNSQCSTSEIIKNLQSESASKNG